MGTQTDMKPCALCLKPAELRDSHIIPEFFYKPFYTQGRRFFRVTTADKRTRLYQKGLRVRLLCQACETHLCKYERVLADFANGKGVGVTPDGKNAIILHGFNYSAVKLGLLSIFWRMSVCDEAFCAECDFGTMHNECLRLMILNGDPGRNADYGIWMSTTHLAGTDIRDFHLQPRRFRVRGKTLYHFFIAGAQLVLFLRGDLEPANHQAGFIQPTGVWKVFNLDIRTIPGLFDEVTRLLANVYV